MPFEPGAEAELRRGAREKAAALNQHVLGYGATGRSRMGGRRHRRSRPACHAPLPARAHPRRAEAPRLCRRPALRPRQHPLRDRLHQHAARGSRTTRPAIASSPPKGRSCCSTISPASICPTIPAWSTRCGRRCRGCISMAANSPTERVERWAAGIADLVRQHGGGNRRIAVDHLDPGRRRRTRAARHFRRQWRGGDGERPADQIARRDPVPCAARSSPARRRWARWRRR